MPGGARHCVGLHSPPWFHDSLMKPAWCDHQAGENNQAAMRKTSPWFTQTKDQGFIMLAQAWFCLSQLAINHSPTFSFSHSLFPHTLIHLLTVLSLSLSLSWMIQQESQKYSFFHSPPATLHAKLPSVNTILPANPPMSGHKKKL
jgi:hypothetical protein